METTARTDQGSSPSVRTSKSFETLPKINTRLNVHNKIYRTPPTPPLEKLSHMEKSFVLDSVAVSNISVDYSRANPKLGSVIPPYNSVDDKHISAYFRNYGVNDLLKKTGQYNEPESIAGRAHDRFFSDGAGYKYLTARNKFGNGHHPETVDGHSRYLGENIRVMFGYNNINGYRRNVPKLRTEPPSTFLPDPRWFDRIKRTYGEYFTDDELVEHFKNTYMIGYPFWDNNYNNYHPSVKYIITVKTGASSPEEYDGNLGINIVAKNFDTGFIKLDENIMKSLKEKRSKKDDRSLFSRDKVDVFEFEDQDIRTISAIILSKDVKGEEVIYIDYVDVQINKANEKQSYRFPVHGWIRGAKQDKKTEEMKERFGKKNSLMIYPNETPKYTYTVIVSPKLFRHTNYTIEINYDVKDLQDQFKYEFEFGSELPHSGRIIVNLFSEAGENVSFSFDKKTKSIDDDNPLVFSISNKEIKNIKYALLYYDNKNAKADYSLENFQVIDPDGEVYLFELDEKLTANKEMKVVSKYIKDDEEDKDEDESTVKKGKLYMKMIGQSQSTGFFLLKNPVESKNNSKKKIYQFKINEIFLDSIQNVRLKYQGSKNKFCKIRNITIKSDKDQDYLYDRKITLRNGEEVTINNRSKNRKLSANGPKSMGQLLVQVFGDKKKTDVFPLKDATTNEDDLDEYYITDNDIGKINGVYLKYDDGKQNENKVNIKYVEVIDPRGNSFKFMMDSDLKSNEQITLPRKSTTKPREEEAPPEKKTEAKNAPQNTDKKPEPEPERKAADDKVEYSVKVSKGAGASNVPITITLIGDKASTEKMRLESKSNSLIEINKDETIKVTSKNVGIIQKLILDYEAVGLKSVWYLNELQVSYNNQVVKFPVERAFTNNETIELIPGQKPPGIDVKNMAPAKKIGNMFKDDDE